MRRRAGLVVLIMAVFFVMSFLTNIMGPIIPDLIADFSLSLTLAAMLPFSFFIAYGVMSIPGGILVERLGEKKAAVGAFLLAFAGALCFALVPAFGTAVPSLFAIGAGMAALQVTLNPVLRAAGGEEHFAFNSVLGQLVFGAASFLSPQVYRWLVDGLRSPAGRPGSLDDRPDLSQPAVVRRKQVGAPLHGRAQLAHRDSIDGTRRRLAGCEQGHAGDRSEQRPGEVRPLDKSLKAEHVHETLG